MNHRLAATHPKRIQPQCRHCTENFVDCADGTLPIPVLADADERLPHSNGAEFLPPHPKNAELFALADSILPAANQGHAAAHRSH